MGTALIGWFVAVATGRTQLQQNVQIGLWRARPNANAWSVRPSIAVGWTCCSTTSGIQPQESYLNVEDTSEENVGRRRRRQSLSAIGTPRIWTPAAGAQQEAVVMARTV